ncbi:MAG: hypothetical protein AB1512_26110 [Thermodesulfobacteriota bacterium]
MTVFTEGNLQITIPDGVTAKKFDDGPTHGLTHCMKAVDLILELSDRVLFIEVKDPDDPAGRQEEREKFVAKFLAGGIDEDLKYKYRDTFLYEWASDRLKKPIYYLVLVAIETLTEADLLARTDDLKRKLPLQGPPSGQWKKRIVEDLAIFNISSWNKMLKRYPIRRRPL